MNQRGARSTLADCGSAVGERMGRSRIADKIQPESRVSASASDRSLERFGAVDA